MDNFVLIDGNSIMNRAFYGIMGSKMLMTKDGKYTNAVYGFLAILFKLIEDTNPKYMAVAFDLKAPTARHKLYEGYKANRKGMPDELAEQMPLIKEILRAMHIDIVEKEGYEADDILGTLSRYGEKQGLDVTILSGDRDTFQLATDKVTIRIPRTKGGKTETETAPPRTPRRAATDGAGRSVRAGFPRARSAGISSPIRRRTLSPIARRSQSLRFCRGRFPGCRPSL